MPMLSIKLERTMRRMLALASIHGHEYVKIEHLLIALLENDEIVEQMKKIEVNSENLMQNMLKYVDSIPSHGENLNPKPEASITKLLTRAALHVQSIGRNEITNLDIFICLLDEQGSYAADLLKKQGIARFGEGDQVYVNKTL